MQADSQATKRGRSIREAKSGEKPQAQHTERGDIFESKKKWGRKSNTDMCRMRKTKRITCFLKPNHALFHAKIRPGGQHSA